MTRHVSILLLGLLIFCAAPAAAGQFFLRKLQWFGAGIHLYF